MQFTFRSILMIVLITAVACASWGPSADTSSRGGDVIRGVVRVTGSAPVSFQVVLQPNEGRSIQLSGPLVEELSRLRGVEVDVWGELGPPTSPLSDGQVEVAGYEILSVDGEPVISGEIISISGDRGRLRTPSGDIVELLAVPAEMEVGQFVWVQGPSGMTVQVYGIVKP